MTEHDPAELLSAGKVAALLHRRKQDVLDDIHAGRIPSVGGKVPRFLLLEWLRAQAGVSIRVSITRNRDRKSVV